MNQKNLQTIAVKKNTAEAVDFSASPFRPLADFFKELCDRRNRARLRLLIPPTLVIGDGGRKLYFTDPETGCRPAPCPAALGPVRFPACATIRQPAPPPRPLAPAPRADHRGLSLPGGAATCGVSWGTSATTRPSCAPLPPSGLRRRRPTRSVPREGRPTQWRSARAEAATWWACWRTRPRSTPRCAAPTAPWSSSDSSSPAVRPPLPAPCRCPAPPRSREAHSRSRRGARLHLPSYVEANGRWQRGCRLGAAADARMPRGAQKAGAVLLQQQVPIPAARASPRAGGAAGQDEAWSCAWPGRVN